MSASPSSSVQEARRELAERLREIRRDANISARVLAERAGWYPSKVSRIQNGTTVPSDDDIRAWCAACSAPGLADDLIAASRHVESMYVEWKRLHRSGLKRLQESRMTLYERTQRFRVYCSNVVPGLFQTPSYASAVLSQFTRFHGAPDDVEEAVAARVNRARILHTERRFTVLVEESVLRSRMGSAETMAGQLGHLLAVMSLPSVALGVVPFAADRPLWPLETFNVFDDNRVHVELLSAAVTVTAPGEVAMYVRAFQEMTEVAVYGRGARALITAAVDSIG